ncbi:MULTISPECIES: MarR family winged helix-turn-helix transcriptional regulator [Streptomyces]|uniref:Transcriptional regulator, MarR family n=1 Tax=Streptomyces venezuelae (strain ATCC 10712 / CBS 650.69 / DSM 40230 / JCM 4526 / NBRC 13096 / PD 04745) TaxID=953739 RepID=F2R5Z4_STRVP|nr:MarR family transcriptional regulator [Streptomyces venezuelae]APE19845.1 MarR family transcriptional regulator [Streptomyces venezuelae]QER97254.1 MarR family transcriptional regulator [Streptomyces venezuelae ATCC 10712]QES04443.1 MarR family transcriptional regulator [Streptomyces venezuelae]QES16816.1 MarR family transcriptional regulator [Streptomyces venezuelae]CCA53655.1 Transcriptional regulator, MarR family [Streptomyces venezuelae ATCC 10712]
MNTDPAPPPREPQQTAEAARELIELLEVLWERGRDMVSSTPVSASQLRVLYSLDREEGISLRTLGDLLGSAPPSVSRMCDRLEALGFVQRLPSPVSRRQLELHLTVHGKAYLRELRVQREEALLAVIADMSPTSRKALLRGLTGFHEALGEGGPAASSRPRTPLKDVSSA